MNFTKFLPLKATLHTTSKRFSHQVVIVGAARTPVGSFMGSLASLKAPQLGSIAVKAAVKRAGVDIEQIDDVVLGNVIQAGQGQGPARQAAIFAGLPKKVNCTTINKLCASGLKSVTVAAQSIMLGHSHLVVAGGFESMSNVPYYIDAKARFGLRLGESKLIDGLLHDGLTDVYHQIHMGVCGENTAKNYSITREMQDKYAIQSYKRAAEALKNGYFKDEIVPVTIAPKKGDKKGDTIVEEDEEITKVDFDKFSTLKPAFDKNGTITAANASTLNDGASAVVVASSDYAKKHHLKPLVKIISFADAEREPIDFPTAPSLAVPVALKRANLSAHDIDFWEINEAFSVVAIVNSRELGIDENKYNVLGGAVSMGHAIGSSGSRILTTLIYHLKRTNKRYGCLAICNGGGGATAMVIENIE